jgi:hypothetical protein
MHEHCVQTDQVELRAFVLCEVFGEDAEAEARGLSDVSVALSISC